MSFSFNPSVEYVKIDEPSLYELFQSKSPVVPDDPSFCGRQHEAYICTAKEGKQQRIFVSFLDTVFKQIHVYTSDSDPGDAADYQRLLAQAHEFVAAKGFVVEKVNIDFSSAIRQVIIRSLRVMRPPPASQKKLLHLVPPAEKTSAEAMAEKPSAAPHKKQVAPERSSPGVERMLAEKDALLQQVRAELEVVKLEVEKVRTERSVEDARTSANYAELQSRYDQAVTAQKNAEELLAKADRQQLLEQDERERLTSEIALLREELTEALAAKDTTAKKSERALASVHKVLAKAVAEKEALEQQLASERVAGAAALEALQDELAALKASLEEDRAVDKALIEKLQSELDTATDAANAELASLAGELAVARASLAHLDQVQNELQDARLELTQLSKDNSLILVELEQLAEERQAERAASADELDLLRAENERLTTSLLIQEQVAQREQTALRAELRAMVAEMAAGGTLPVQAAVPSALEDVQLSPVKGNSGNAAPPPAVAGEPLPEQPEQEHEELHEEEADASSSGAAEAMAMLDPESTFSAAGADSSTEFRLDAGLDTVPYRSSVEVLAVFFSINTIQAVPIGREVQKCSGYVCAVAEDGVPRMYIAWHMPESGRVAVYVPYQQPGDKESCATVLRDAIQYFEIMGFMMEKHDLGATPQKRRSVLKKIPVLKRVEKGHAEHAQPEPLKQSA